MDNLLPIKYEPFPGKPAWSVTECDRFTLENELATCENDWSEVDAVMPTPAVDHLANGRLAHEIYLAEKAAGTTRKCKSSLPGCALLSGGGLRASR